MAHTISSPIPIVQMQVLKSPRLTDQRIFKVARAITAKITAKIQKRNTILNSGMPMS